MKRFNVIQILLCTSATWATGCADDDVNIGDGSSTAALGAALADYAGPWEGYVEAFVFADGSDRLRITLDENGAGEVVVGDSPRAAPPTDPEAPYPSGAEGIEAVLQPEFSYAVQGAAVSDRRIKFQVSRFEAYEDYCALLPPVYDVLNSSPETPVYGCASNDGTSGWRGNCRAMCVCDAESCFVYDYPPDDTFDCALSAGGDELSGTTVLYGERYNVRLYRP